MTWPVAFCVSSFLLVSFYFSLFVQELDIIYRIPHAVPISAHHKWNFDDLLEKMWEYLDLVRMYACMGWKGRGEGFVCVCESACKTLTSPTNSTSSFCFLLDIPNPRGNFPITAHPLYFRTVGPLWKICVTPYTRAS